MSTETNLPSWTPPRWLNWFMKLMLQTPGLQRWIGRGVALITFTGRKSDRRYSTPISYVRDGNRVTALTRRTRSWWRNFGDRPDVELRLAGTKFRADAMATVDDPAAIPNLISFLEARPRDAKAYGVSLDAEGRLAEADAKALLPHVVMLTFTIRVPRDG